MMALSLRWGCKGCGQRAARVLADYRFDEGDGMLIEMRPAQRGECVRAVLIQPADLPEQHAHAHSRQLPVRGTAGCGGNELRHGSEQPRAAMLVKHALCRYAAIARDAGQVAAPML